MSHLSKPPDYSEPAALEELHRRSRKGLSKMHSNPNSPTNLDLVSQEEHNKRAPENIRLDKWNLKVGETYDFFMKNGGEPWTMKLRGYYEDYHKDGDVVHYVKLTDRLGNEYKPVLNSIRYVTPTSSYGGKRKYRSKTKSKTKSKIKTKKNKKRTQHRRS